jgi:hypothetical protein
VTTVTDNWVKMNETPTRVLLMLGIPLHPGRRAPRWLDRQMAERRIARSHHNRNRDGVSQSIPEAIGKKPGILPWLTPIFDSDPASDFEAG